MNKPDYISAPDWDILLSKYEENQIKEYLDKNYPYQYLIGDVEFYNSTIKVNENVLIPRWETEELVNRVVNKLAKYNYKPTKGLDICTGSGCIAISLSKKYDIIFDAIDISKKALDQAMENVKLNKVKVNFINSNVLNDKISGTYDLIISNPPYVSYDEEVGLETKFEPQNAIFADHKGLAFYEEILKKIRYNLSNKFMIAMEINSNLKDEIENIAKSYFLDATINLEKDLNDRYRYLFITNIE